MEGSTDGSTDGSSDGFTVGSTDATDGITDEMEGRTSRVCPARYAIANYPPTSGLRRNFQNFQNCALVDNTTAHRLRARVLS